MKPTSSEPFQLHRCRSRADSRRPTTLRGAHQPPCDHDALPAAAHSRGAPLDTTRSNCLRASFERSGFTNLTAPATMHEPQAVSRVSSAAKRRVLTNMSSSR
eukprot:CAMPEP_0119404276 /NCGR_PEP_ID=MMETSP1334-20130426/143813_1 /TAXON_ID=127549 /ORGANISM="Calcidiscus leptoporus, Strain RCC1130" /LENGTH=101 /DNA_ID=CAMNT_0007428239 /DNA_START=448 /DNA_END=753 /DNA_ORIENTATION=+